MAILIVRKVFLLLALLTLLALLPHDVHAAGTWYVSPSGNDKHACTSRKTACGSIKGVLANAGFLPGDSIKVAEGTYTGKGPQVVLLDKNVNVSGGWNIKFNAQTGTSIIDAEGKRRGVVVNSNVTATLDRLQIQNGTDTVKGDGWGGGIKNFGTLTLTNSHILNNSALKHNNGGYGAGIYSTGGGSLTILNSTISNNTAFSGGGGIYAQGTVIIRDSTISKNTIGQQNTMATHGGAAIWANGADLTIERSTISSNKIIGDFMGSAIDASSGTLTLSNSTISGNKGPHEVIGVHGTTLNINDSTLANKTPYGIQLYAATVNLKHSVLANHSTADCNLYTLVGNTFISLGYNVIKQPGNCTADASDVTGTDPLLDKLKNNGGTTSTLALLPGSVAIDLVPTNACPPPDTDQRGAARPADGNNDTIASCDAGAFEFGAGVP